MKKIIYIIAALITLHTGVTAQSTPAYFVADKVYSNTQYNGTNGLCAGCSVIEPSKANGNNASDFSKLKLTGSAKNGAYVYQNLVFPIMATSGSQITVLVSKDNTSEILLSEVQNIQVYTVNNGKTNKDTLTANQASFSEIDNTGIYMIQFNANGNFNTIGIKLNQSTTSTLASIRIYSSYFSSEVLPVNLADAATTTQNDVIEPASQEVTLTSANPFESSVSISYYTAANSTVEINLIDMMGNSVYNHMTESTEGYHTSNIDGLNGLTEGIYSLSVSIDGKVTTKRIVKK
jgi:hypothetical protein